ncbi:O-antigen ligase family protein [Lacinutrix undariae]
MGKHLNISVFALILMFILLPVDMINGALLKNNINLPLSIGQFHKLSILLVIFLSFLFKKNSAILSFSLLSVLLLPSIFQVFMEFELGFLFKDLIKITRYLTPVFAFFFFVNYIKKGNSIHLLFLLVKFSYIVFCANILLKYLGLGYPMYSYGSVGSKGFFFAGNETSVVLIILSSILAYKLWLEQKTKKYIYLFLFTLFVGITISSKTGLLGVILTFLLLPLKPVGATLSKKRLKIVVIAVILAIIGYFIFISDTIQNTAILKRTNYFFNKLDVVTFLFSNRNNFFIEALDMYAQKYNFIEKIIGVGQAHYEVLNGNGIVEIDIADIFFAYGVVGLTIFISLITFLIVQAYKFKKSGKYPFSGLVIVMLFILLGISTIAGHVFSSGMAAVFIGLLFSLMYVKNEAVEN